MKLTAKCKEDFEKWLRTKTICSNLWFYTLPLSMQYGIYVDFFDSLKIDVNVKSNQNGFFSRVNDITTYKGKGTIRGFKTRGEARSVAIEKANEIYNEK